MTEQKYLVISDIHGGRNGAETLLEAMKHHGISTVLCLGDVLYHGPRNDLPQDYDPKTVISLMNSIKDNIIAVRGNCEAEVDQMVLEFSCMADYNIIPFSERKVFMSHGHIYSPDHLPALRPGDIFLSGHTHIPTCNMKDGIYLLNPGSITLPKENHPQTYAVLTEHSFTIYTKTHEVYMQTSFK